MKELNSYVDVKVLPIDARSQFPPVELHVIRKPSGNIATVLFGSKSRNTIRDQYYRDPHVLDKHLPILYTATSKVGDTQGEFLVAQEAIEARSDSLKYVEWEDGDAPGKPAQTSPEGARPEPPRNPLADIYLVEKIMGGDPFILATLLGPTVQSDVVRPLPRADRLVKDVIRSPTEQVWITDDGWVAYGMQDLKCDSDNLKDYQHQIFVRGPPKPAS
ncbi:hypothetical protein DFH08DRAFT_1002131 [Mycena albidolilacea]|uniref:Uncharacterized protein n=1 Tax=Mycena albidolilacea TaxID=1033008 RepID=A0AAD7A211_9AGAR|nr:hypothetical protein DFH08DRAFT_1002131 [Mycena albidolilacea]